MRLETLPGLSALDPARVRQFMRTRGWVLEEAHSRPPLFFNYMREGETAVVVGRRLKDFARRTAELIELLARVHGQSVFELMDDLSAPMGDVVEVRIISESVRDGTLPLEYAARYQQANRDMLLAAAHSELSPQPYYPRMAKREALEVLARCRAGQSARGSYRMRTIVQMDPQVGQLDLDPLARRVVRRLYSATAAAVGRLDTDRAETLLSMHAEGLSANLLASLARFEPPGDGGAVELGVRWSHGHPVPPGVYRPVRLEGDTFEYFRSAARSIRAQTPEVGFQMRGYVVQLKRDKPKGGGTAFVFGEVPDVGGRKVAVKLEEAAYTEMITAHKAGREVVVSGTLQQRGRSYELLRATVGAGL